MSTAARAADTNAFIFVGSRSCAICRCRLCLVDQAAKALFTLEIKLNTVAELEVAHIARIAEKRIKAAAILENNDGQRTLLGHSPGRKERRESHVGRV